VPVEERERVFERLYRGDRSRAAGAAGGSGGAGLGLAICRALARGQGGDVTVRGTPGGGATFVVTLPAAPPPDSEADGVEHRDGVLDPAARPRHDHVRGADR
jgi:signal transduction histidine kinase